MNLFHLSSTWNEKKLKVIPRVGRNDAPDEPRDSLPFIAVCPSIAQSVIALGEWYDYDRVKVYMAKDGQPVPATWVFDYHLTQEHRFFTPTIFYDTGMTVDCQLLQELVVPLKMTGSDSSILKNAKTTLKVLQKFF